ncbi:unnamed protein product [Macrosiphum euphorbiae]|uniref:Uncharacterized protein n=1 Tax=Macrosiphum euphorbiae TaxID=13131 RepID=A0AAV0VUU5_9HEMI|nr:unnamed protein product [Macrosiphum euphorbiae]
MVVGCLADDTGRRGCTNTGSRNDSGQEPLELHEFSAQVADGRRKHGDRFHAISRRRPGQLHGGGHFRRLPVEARYGRDADDPGIWRSVRVDEYLVWGLIRIYCDAIYGNHKLAYLIASEASRLASTAFRSRTSGSACDLLDPLTDDHIHRAAVHRSRVQYFLRVQHIGQPRRARHIRPEFHQYSAADVQHGQD